MVGTASGQAVAPDPGRAGQDVEGRRGGGRRGGALRLVVVGLAVAGAAGIAALAIRGGGDSGPGGTGDVSTEGSDRRQVVLAPARPASGDQLDEAAGIIRDRADALGVTGVEVAREGDALVVDVPEGDRGDRLVELVDDQGELRFRPVLDAMPTVADAAASVGPVTPAEDDRADRQVSLEDTEGEMLYVLGPALATGRVVETAEAELDQVGRWQVALTLLAGAEGIERFNQAAAACWPPGPRCPAGQLAIVLDSVVRSAPTIQQGSFERDDIVITGDFSESEAQDLALVLTSGSLPVDLEPQPAEAGD